MQLWREITESPFAIKIFIDELFEDLCEQGMCRQRCARLGNASITEQNNCGFYDISAPNVSIGAIKQSISFRVPGEKYSGFLMPQSGAVTRRLVYLNVSLELNDSPSEQLNREVQLNNASQTEPKRYSLHFASITSPKRLIDDSLIEKLDRNQSLIAIFVNSQFKVILLFRGSDTISYCVVEEVLIQLFLTSIASESSLPVYER